jgi:hypothetical protein
MRISFVLSVFFVLLSFVLPVFTQTTVGTRSIVGVVTDPSGSVLWIVQFCRLIRGNYKVLM